MIIFRSESRFSIAEFSQASLEKFFVVEFSTLFSVLFPQEKRENARKIIMSFFIIITLDNKKESSR